MGAAKRNPQNVKLAKALRAASKDLDLPVPTLLQAIKCGDAPITDVICDYWEWYGGNGACEAVSSSHLQSSPYRYVLGDCMPRRKNSAFLNLLNEPHRSEKVGFYHFKDGTVINLGVIGENDQNLRKQTDRLWKNSNILDESFRFNSLSVADARKVKGAVTVNQYLKGTTKMPRRKNAHPSDCKIEGSRSWKKIDYIVGYNDLEKSWFAYSKAWSGWLWGRSEKEIVTKARKGIDKHLAPSPPAWGGRTPLALSRKRKNATSPLKFSFQHSKAGGSVTFRKGKVGKVGRMEVSVIPTNPFHAYLYDEAPNWVLIRDYFNIVRSDGSGKAVPYATKQKVWVAAQQALEKETGLSPTSRARPRKRNPRKRKGQSKKQFVEEVWAKRAPKMPSHSYGPRKGLEGPFQYGSGKVLYWDAKEGAYYDPGADMYLSNKDALAFIMNSRSNPRQRRNAKVVLPKSGKESLYDYSSPSGLASLIVQKRGYSYKMWITFNRRGMGWTNFDLTTPHKTAKTATEARKTIEKFLKTGSLEKGIVNPGKRKNGRDYTDAALLTHLKGTKGGITVRDLTYAFGGQSSYHTARLRKLVKAGKVKAKKGYGQKITHYFIANPGKRKNPPCRGKVRGGSTFVPTPECRGQAQAMLLFFHEMKRSDPKFTLKDAWEISKGHKPVTKLSKKTLAKAKRDAPVVEQTALAFNPRKRSRR